MLSGWRYFNFSYNFAVVLTAYGFQAASINVIVLSNNNNEIREENIPPSKIQICVNDMTKYLP